MTRSIFDPDSGETERSGSRNLGPDAEQISQLPPDLTGGIIDDTEAEEEDAVMDMPSADEIMHPSAEAPDAEATDDESPTTSA